MSIEEKRNAVIEKLQKELDEFVTANTNGNQQVQQRLIVNAAPTIDNCIEIIFALSEYGDDLELTESDYDKLLNSEHTLLALNERFVSSEYHTTDSGDIINFINDFVRNENAEMISRFGSMNYEGLMDGIDTVKEESDYKLDFASEILSQLSKTRGFILTKDDEYNEYCVSSAVTGNRIAYCSATPTKTPNGNDSIMFMRYDDAEQDDVEAFNSVYRSVWQDIYNYNRSVPFPERPYSKDKNDEGWRIVDTLGDYILCANALKDTPYKQNVVEYAVWEYDNTTGNCYHGDYYNGPNSYEAARRRLAERANVYPQSCACALDMGQLSEVVHSLPGDAFDVLENISSDTVLKLYETYDKSLASKASTECLSNGFYPINKTDANVLLCLPQKKIEEYGLVICPLYSNYHSYLLSDALADKISLSEVSVNCYEDYLSLSDELYNGYKTDTVFGIRCENKPDTEMNFSSFSDVFLSPARWNLGEMINTYNDELFNNIGQGGGRS